MIENRAGAAGTIGATAAARSEPDGYTLVMFPGGHPLYGATHKSLPFDTVTSFEWISTVVTLQFLALVRAEAKYQSMAELIAAAKAAPEIDHLCERRGRLDPPPDHRDDRQPRGRQIPARSLSGRRRRRWARCWRSGAVHAATPTQAIGNIQGGKVRALAVTGNTRMPAVPDVPTVEEATGFKDFDVRTWFGLAGAGRRAGRDRRAA